MSKIRELIDGSRQVVEYFPTIKVLDADAASLELEAYEKVITAARELIIEDNKGNLTGTKMYALEISLASLDALNPK